MQPRMTLSVRNGSRADVRCISGSTVPCARAQRVLGTEDPPPRLAKATSSTGAFVAGGWSRDGAVQDQIDDSVKDAVLEARSRLAAGEGETLCVECGEEIPPARWCGATSVRTASWEDPPLRTYNGRWPALKPASRRALPWKVCQPSPASVVQPEPAGRLWWHCLAQQSELDLVRPSQAPRRWSFFSSSWVQSSALQRHAGSTVLCGVWQSPQTQPSEERTGTRSRD
jgi:hypothetical protein